MKQTWSITSSNMAHNKTQLYSTRVMWFISTSYPSGSFCTGITRQLKQRNPKHRAGAVSLRLIPRGRTEPATDRKFQASFSIDVLIAILVLFQHSLSNPGFYKSRHKCLFASSLWQTAGMVSVRTQNLAWPHPPICWKRISVPCSF